MKASMSVEHCEAEGFMACSDLQSGVVERCLLAYKVCGGGVGVATTRWPKLDDAGGHGSGVEGR